MLSIFLGLIAPSADVESRIISASLFKNGYAMVLREVDASGTGASITRIPISSLGTLWLTTSEGLRLKAVINTTRETAKTTPIGNLGEFLRANKGKKAMLTVIGIDSTAKLISGVLEDIVGEMVYVRNGADLVGLRTGNVAMASIEGEAKTTVESKTDERVLTFQTEGSGKIYMLGLERGLTWSPGYTIDISNPKELRLLAKSTVLNDLGAFNQADLKFVTGFPNVPWATIREPLLSGDSMESYIQMLQGIGLPTSGFAGRRDSQMMMNQSVGGFSPMAEMEVSGQGGEMAEDLFFYSQPKVTMKQGDRAFFLLFEAKSAFEHIYTLDIPNTINENESYNPNPNQREVPYDVWHTIKFKNTSKQPLTTAPATVYKDGQIMGQDTLMYTSAGADANVKMSKALDVQNDANEEESARERAALKTPNYGVFDLVTIKGTVVLRNRKSESVTIHVTKMLQGELITSDNGAKTTKVAKGLRDVNPRTKLDWNIDLAAGKTLTLNYAYKVYVRA